MFCFVFFKQKTAYEMRISDWSSDVCSSDLFAYGSTASNGSSSSTSYLWEYSNENNALPFTQVFIRPKLTNLSYEDLPAGGTPPQAISPLMQNTTEGPTQPWAVTGK